MEPIEDIVEEMNEMAIDPSEERDNLIRIYLALLCVGVSMCSAAGIYWLFSMR